MVNTNGVQWRCRITFVWIVIIIWLIVLSYVVFRMVRHYNRLTTGFAKESLKEILEAVLERQSYTKNHIEGIEKTISDIQKNGKLHVQKIGLVRFNPFSDTGGSQSFTLAILDGKDNGLVMTSLYARTGNRWYVKEIFSGKGREYELSREEVKAIQTARSMAE